MAYMNQEKKKALAPKIKEVLKKYKVKGTLAVKNHSTLVLNIQSGELDFIGNSNSADNYIQVNVYWINDRYSGECKSFLNEVKDAMMVGNHDNSDIMTDFFDVGFYIDINIGRYDKPYVFKK